ncbi:MAG: helix-turn-helix domain-containing protein [Halioglobus sp.]|nr:helix-turn-helix domain-containing protein [Halioglobus sp.]
MKWHELAQQQCSVARSLAVIGDRWTLMILRDLFLGARRFETLRDSLGISRTILTERLNLLESEGVIRRHAYQERPLRHEYHLTGKGVDLYPVLLTIVGWGDKYYAGEDGPPIVQHHKACGHDFHAVLTCSECGEAVSPFETEPRAGDAFPDLAAALARRE